MTKYEDLLTFCASKKHFTIFITYVINSLKSQTIRFGRIKINRKTVLNVKDPGERFLLKSRPGILCGKPITGMI